MSDLQGVDVQRWQGLGVECRSVREPWYQSFGLRTDFLGEVRKREKGREKKDRGLGNPSGCGARLGQSSEGYRLSLVVWTRSAPSHLNQKSARKTLRQG